MRRGKYQNKRTSKVAVILLVLVLLLGCTVGGTLAWLTAQSNSVTNTFVVGDIGTLTLTENGVAASNNTEKFTIVPGVNLKKDVTVTYNYDEIADDYEDISVYVFVKIATTANTWTISSDGKTYTVVNESKELLSWTVDDSWTHLENGVYYQVVTAQTGDTDTSFTDDVIANDGAITVSNEITKDTIDEVSAAAGDIKFTAYAIQSEGHADATAAWAALNG